MTYCPRTDALNSYTDAVDALREKYAPLYKAGAKRVIEIGDAMLIEGDCLEIMPALGRVDAVVTDPPYGLGDKWQGGNAASKGRWKLSDGGANMGWDAALVEAVTAFPGICGDAIIWGGNYYALPPARGWLLWDKIVRQWTSGHAEMAWTTLDQPVRAFNYAHGELAIEGKAHPTQKPLPLMRWCLDFLPKARTILDPFMGSGTTLVAATQLGRKSIGIEIDPEYFDIACKRVREAWAQPRLFDEPKAKPAETGSLFDGEAT